MVYVTEENRGITGTPHEEVSEESKDSKADGAAGSGSESEHAVKILSRADKSCRQHTAQRAA